MKKPLLLFAFCVSVIFLFIIAFNNKAVNSNTVKILSGGNSGEDYDKEDGIAAEQQMEFEHTKDLSLGYIPKYRLINAIEDLKTARQNGTYPDQITSLSWTERGSYTDAAGASGNPRTPGAVTSGRVRAIWVDNGDVTGKTVWIGGIDGGLWKTTDITASPASWVLINDFFSNLAIASICQDPTDVNVMYFGTGEKTFNADAVRGGGVWRSADHGATWALLGATTSYFNVSKVLCDASGNIYVSTINQSALTVGSGDGLYRSTKASAGAAWTNIAPSSIVSWITDFQISSTGRMHINGGYQEGSGDLSFCGYRYTNTPATVTPATWTSATTPYPASTEGCQLACLGTTLLALRVSSNNVPTIYKSTDGGDNWAAIGSTPAFTSGQAWYCLSADINPADATQMIVGSLDNYKSTDGGATWVKISNWVCPCATGKYIHADQQIVKWYAGNKVLFGCDGGVFYSPDGGATVSDKNTNLRLKQFFSCAMLPAASSNYFLAGAQDNGVHQFNGAGLTSSVEVTGGDGAFVHIDQDQPQYQFGSYVYNNYRRSTDGGASWSAATSDNNGSFINPTDYDNINNIMYCGRNANEYNRWDNPQTGGTLTQVSMAGLAGGFVSHVKVSPYTSNRVFFGGGNDPSLGTGGGKILRTDNANVIPSVTDITGSGMTANTNVSCIAIGTTDNNLIATFSNYGAAHVWVSTVGGGAGGWTNISGNLPDIPVRWAIFYPGDNTKAILATEMGIYESGTFNGGSTVWTQNPSFPVVRTDMLKYRSSDATIAAATHGRGLWTTTVPGVLPVTLVDISGNLLQKNIALSWITSSENNSNYFELQKSADGIHFFVIGNVNAAGNSSLPITYNFTDGQVNEFNYYRLKMVDKDGKFVYSKVILIRAPGAQQDVRVINNPFHSYLDIRLARAVQHSAEFELINMAGAVIYKKESGITTETRLDFSSLNLSNGTYILKTNIDGKSFTNKVVKQ